MKTLSVTNRPDGVAVVTFDAPGSSVNVISEEALRDFQEAMNQILADSLASREAKIRACVLVSAKKYNFIAGADLGAVSKTEAVSEGTRVSRAAQVEQGKQNPQMAILSGKLKISNVAVMMKYTKAFGKVSP